MAKKRKIRRKGKRPKSKSNHKVVKIWELYRVEGGKVIRTNEFCPKCGAGTFLAKRGNRQYCGKCGFTIVKEK